MYLYVQQIIYYIFFNIEVEVKQNVLETFKKLKYILL